MNGEEGKDSRAFYDSQGVEPVVLYQLDRFMTDVNIYWRDPVKRLWNFQLARRRRRRRWAEDRQRASWSRLNDGARWSFGPFLSSKEKPGCVLCPRTPFQHCLGLRGYARAFRRPRRSTEFGSITDLVQRSLDEIRIHINQNRSSFTSSLLLLWKKDAALLE